MCDKKIIEEAVRLAEGFEADSVNKYYWHDPGHGEGFDGICVDQSDPDQWFLDALAAQLVRDYSKISPNDRLCYADDVMETIRYVVDKLHSR